MTKKKTPKTKLSLLIKKIKKTKSKTQLTISSSTTAQGFFCPFFFSPVFSQIWGENNFNRHGEKTPRLYHFFFFSSLPFNQTLTNFFSPSSLKYTQLNIPLSSETPLHALWSCLALDAV